MKREPAPLRSRDRVRYQLLLAGLNITTAAAALGIDVRTMRRYAQSHPVPRLVDYALLGLIAEKHGMQI